MCKRFARKLLYELTGEGARNVAEEVQTLAAEPEEVVTERKRLQKTIEKMEFTRERFRAEKEILDKPDC